MAYRLEALGVSVNVLIIGRLIQGSGDYATAFRIRQYFDDGRQSWAARNLNSFEDQKDFLKFLLDNRVDCIFGINAHVVANILTGCSVPFAIVLSGSELVENVKNPDELSAMTAIVENARMVITNAESVHAKAIKTWPTLPRERLLLVARAVITRPAPKADTSCLDEFQLDKDAVIFLMVTRLTRAKDPLQIVPAFTHWHQLHEKHPFLVIVGAKVDVEYYKEFAEMTDGCPGIIWVGPQSMKDTHRLIADCFALVNSSISGGTSTCILEAMDLGVPVLARRNNVHKTFIEHEKTGLLYTFPEDFIEKAEMLMDRSNLREKIVENARSFVQKNLDCSKERNDFAQIAIKLKNSGRKKKRGGGGGKGGGEGGANEEAIAGEATGEGEGEEGEGEEGEGIEEVKSDDASGKINVASDSSEKKVRFRLPNAGKPNAIPPGPEIPSSDQPSTGTNPEGKGGAEGGKGSARKLRMKSPRASISCDVEVRAAAAAERCGKNEIAAVTQMIDGEGHESRVLSSGSGGNSRPGGGSTSGSKEKLTKAAKKRATQRRDSSPIKTTTGGAIATLGTLVDSKSPSTKVNLGERLEDEGSTKPSSARGASRRPSGNKATLKRQASQKYLK